jgi:hypothetical protein
MSSRSLMHRVFPPSKPPDGGYPPSFRLVVGRTQLRGSWYLSAVVRLQGFSSHSPVAPLHWWSPKTVTSSSWMERGKPGCDLCGGDVLQPCQGRRTIAAQLGCNIPPSSLHSRRGRQRGPAGALGSGPLFGFNSWFASLERECEREPSGGRVQPGTMAAAAEVAGGPPGVRRPAGSRLFIPAGTEPEFRL